MNLYSFADKIVFRILKDIDSGYLEITSFDGEIMKFGNPKNTFGEQHTYVFKVKNDNLLQHNCEKKFHVSPFIEMNCNYFFRILKPTDKISVIIDQYQLDEKILYASQDGKRTDFTTSELIKSYLKHPLMTFKIITAIHFEAFKLWTKGIKFIQKKLKIRNNISFEN